jgi:hypothetical protein
MNQVSNQSLMSSLSPFLLADNSNMKRENEDNYEDEQQLLDDEQQQMLQGDELAPEQGTDNDDSQDANNDTNNLNSQNNQNQDNGVGPNPPKRQRRNDDEEVRLLIPSKVSMTYAQLFSLANQLISILFPPLKDGWSRDWQRRSQHPETAH